MYQSACFPVTKKNTDSYFLQKTMEIYLLYMYFYISGHILVRKESTTVWAEFQSVAQISLRDHTLTTTT